MNRLSTLDVVSKKLQAASFAIIATMSAWYAFVLPALPDRIPVHWSPTGPNRWGSKHEMWVFVGVMLMNTAITWVTAWAITRGKERDLSSVSSDLALAAKTVLEDQKRLGVRMVEWIFFFINVGMAGMWWVAVEAARTGDVGLINRGVMALMALMLVAIVVPMAVALRRGMHNQKKIRDILPADSEDGWIAGGAIYYAPQDERLWVEKRLGFGWTLNFAKPASWWILVALLGVPLLITIVIVASAS